MTTETNSDALAAAGLDGPSGDRLRRLTGPITRGSPKELEAEKRVP